MEMKTNWTTSIEKMSKNNYKLNGLHAARSG